MFIVGFFVTNIGRWIELTGAVWLAYELTGSPLLLGLVGLARAVPAILLSPIAGVIADRVDQRRMVQATQGTALLLSLAMGLLIASGRGRALAPVPPGRPPVGGQLVRCGRAPGALPAARATRSC